MFENHNIFKLLSGCIREKVHQTRNLAVQLFHTIKWTLTICHNAK